MFMKKLVYDVFIGQKAVGNPCGVVELSQWLNDSELLDIAREIDQPVTSFVVRTDDQFFIRWFSRQSEINLCGHGSLGAGAAMLDSYRLNALVFSSKHGDVTISRHNERYSIVLPSWQGESVGLPEQLSGLAAEGHIVDVFATRDLVVVLSDEQAVANYRPDFAKIANVPRYHALILTAQSGVNSYVLRYFAPGIGIDEDRATGSAQCSLAPYWLSKLDATSLSVNQLSQFGGYFEVEQNSNGSIVVSAQVKERFVSN